MSVFASDRVVRTTRPSPQDDPAVAASTFYVCFTDCIGVCLTVSCVDVCSAVAGGDIKFTAACIACAGSHALHCAYKCAKG